MVAITITRNIDTTAFIFVIGPLFDRISAKNFFTMLEVLMMVILLSVFISTFMGRNFASMVLQGTDITLGDSLSVG
jgi:hypothetical protein